MKLEVENMKRIIIDVEDELYTDLELLAGGLQSLRTRIVVDLIKTELDRQKLVVEKMREVEKKKQEHLDLLRKRYLKESENDNNDNGEKYE